MLHVLISAINLLFNDLYKKNELIAYLRIFCRKKFGWVTFMLNFFMFFLFLLVLTYFAVKSKAEWINKCDSECKNQVIKLCGHCFQSYFD